MLIALFLITVSDPWRLRTSLPYTSHFFYPICAKCTPRPPNSWTHSTVSMPYNTTICLYRHSFIPEIRCCDHSAHPERRRYSTSRLQRSTDTLEGARRSCASAVGLWTRFRPHDLVDSRRCYIMGRDSQFVLSILASCSLPLSAIQTHRLFRSFSTVKFTAMATVKTKSLTFTLE